MSSPSDRRKQLNTILKNLIGNDNVYFQPPKNVSLKYPCIVYHITNGDSRFADDMPYTFTRRYEISYITKNPDDENINEIAKLPKTLYTNQYTVDGLYHNIYDLYY